MFSIFPSLLGFESFAPVLLRLVLGSIFIYWGYSNVKKRGDKNAIAIGCGEILVGVLFVIGLFTQLVALISLIVFAVKIYKKISSKQFLTDGVNYYLILLIISLCLLFTGPGFIAFDLPL